MLRNLVIVASDIYKYFDFHKNFRLCKEKITKIIVFTSIATWSINNIDYHTNGFRISGITNFNANIFDKIFSTYAKHQNFNETSITDELLNFQKKILEIMVGWQTHW